MSKRLYLFFLLAIPLIESCRETQSPYELEGTLWYNEFYGETDSMRFLENNVAEYFLAEKAWWAPSTYIPKDDTLYLLTQRKAYIPENLEAPDPEIVQKLIFHNDTMTMVYQAIYRGENISVSKPVDFHFIKVKDDWWSLLWKDE